MESKPIKVLVAEDTSIVRLMFPNMLKAPRFELVLASDGKEGLARYDATIDIVFTDVEMPNMCGPRMAEEIRRQDARCPIYFVTGGLVRLSPDDQTLYHTLLADGRVQGVIPKPFSPKDLLGTVDKHYPQSL